MTKGIAHELTISDTIGTTDTVTAHAETAAATATAHDADTQVVELATVESTDKPLPIRPSQSGH